MKKILVIGLAMVLVLTLSVAAFAETRVIIGGEGNFGYDFADDGYDFSDYALTVNVDVASNISLFAKVKTEPAANKAGTYFTDKCYATLAYAPVTWTVGYFGFGFGGGRDILNQAVSDFKSITGIEAEMALGKRLNGKVYVALDESKTTNYFTDTTTTPPTIIPVTTEELDHPLDKGAYAFALDYANDYYGLGVVYGDTAFDKGTCYAINGFLKPTPDLIAFVNYGFEDASDNTAIILGAIYASAKSPWEFRAEFDVDDENNGADSFNPWGLRAAYRINPNVKIQADVNEKTSGSEQQQVKLNICF
jgi:hypothetical protein